MALRIFLWKSLGSFLKNLDKIWSEPMRPVEDAVGAAKTFSVSEILEDLVVLKFFFFLIFFFNINYLSYTTTYEFTSLLKLFSFQSHC